MDDITPKQLALALLLDLNLDDIEVSSYDENNFEINPRTEKWGEPPSYYEAWAKDLHAFLSERNQDVKTWQELAIMDDKQYMSELLYKLEGTANFHPHDDYSRGVVTVQERDNEGKMVTVQRAEVHEENGERLKMLAKMNPREMVAYERFKRKLLGWDDVYKRWKDWPQKDGEIHWYANGFYHLIGSRPEDAKQWHVESLRKAFNGEPVEDTRDDMQVDSGQYLVLTDEEADEKAKESVENYVEDCVLSEIPENYRNYFDTDRFVEDCVSLDGRAHSLASYDGEEREINLGDHYDDIIMLFRRFYNMLTEEEDQVIEKIAIDTTLDPELDFDETFFIYRTN